MSPVTTEKSKKSSKFDVNISNSTRVTENCQRKNKKINPNENICFSSGSIQHQP